ncbi:MAG TPA: carboxypeptidase-like regulatory domain-containing protein, partial [Terriglobales bacterium]|nr:carboxypeptidase-like regulatory domain-containing protein [Terriglobales bacterium]
MRFRLFLKLTTLLVAALFATQVMAQSIVTGDIVGTVTDPSNAVVSGATVTMASPSTGSTETTTTNSTGFYRFALVKPGTYKLSVAQSGFRTISAMVSVDIGKVNTANLQLQLGQGSETVEVTGAAPLIQTEDANLSTSYSQNQVNNLPAPGGDITSYAYTAPGVVVSNGAGYGNFSSFGLPSTANLFTTNGNDEMDPFLNLNNSGASNLLIGSNELQEIAVVNN